MPGLFRLRVWVMVRVRVIRVRVMIRVRVIMVRGLARRVIMVRVMVRIRSLESSDFEGL
jgi:hypothetical protein